jgi:hypothetical protein
LVNKTFFNCKKIHGETTIKIMLRKMFGPTRERDGTWRIKKKDELDIIIYNIY